MISNYDEYAKIIGYYSENDVLNIKQLHDLYKDLRLGELSKNQIQAALSYCCIGNVCTKFELFDLLCELDRRYFLLQDLRWEFSLLDTAKSDVISVPCAKRFVQIIHKNMFSEKKWRILLENRPSIFNPIAFEEIEVMLCNIPEGDDLKIDKIKQDIELDELNKLVQDAENEEKDISEKLKRKEDDVDAVYLREVLLKSRERKIRYNLKGAIIDEKKNKLETAIKDFKDEKLTDIEGDLKKGEDLLLSLHTREKLLEACQKKDVAAIEAAIDLIKRSGHENKLQQDLNYAYLLLLRIRRLDRIRKEILALTQPTISEIRSYQKPPKQVFTVMKATLLLLGHKESECKEWIQIQALVGKLGKDSLKRRCLELSPSSVNPDLARKVSSIIDCFELEEVLDVSAGAATFFYWTKGIIEEVLEENL